MPSWNQVLEEIDSFRAGIDLVRRKYLKELHEITDTNIIAYYSGWLTKPQAKNTFISDDDKNGFMTTIHGLDRSKGLFLILHTPGGDLGATESIIDYLRKMFDNNITAIVPQIAMSAGTIIACSCKRIIMGKQSNLGPIDPQFNGISMQGVLDEFKKAIQEVKKDKDTIPIWQQVISKYHPTFIGECKKGIDWAKKIVTDNLKACMFEGDSDAGSKAEDIYEKLCKQGREKSHARHIPVDECNDIGLNIEFLEKYEEDKNFQDILLTVHHAFMHTFSKTTSIKIIENHLGNAMVIFEKT